MLGEGGSSTRVLASPVRHVRAPAPGEVVVQYNDYTNTFFSILRGSVDIRLNPDDPTNTVSLGAGKFFG